MILAIDIGNTNIVVGCIDDKKTYFIERLSTVRTKTELEYAVDLKTVLDIYHIKKTDIEGCIISSVVPSGPCGKCGSWSERVSGPFYCDRYGNCNHRLRCQ